MEEPDALVAQARDAIERGAWDRAYAVLHAVDRARLSAGDLEHLADAAWWVSRLDESLDVRHRAYAAYVAEGDERAAGATAARLAIEHFLRDEPSVGAGFLRRAQRHLRSQPGSAERAFVDVVEATVARFSGDTEGAVALAQHATEVGARLGDPDLVAMAIHTEGLALIDAGRVPDGLAAMDEAMAAVVAGEVHPFFTGIIYCNLIQSCLELGDVRRAGEWSDAARIWLETVPAGSPFPGMCRVNRAEVFRLRGAWMEAEAEAVRACEELIAVDPLLTGSAFVQVGEVRRRIGDVAGAAEAFTQASELGVEPQPGLALLQLAQGKAGIARTGLRLALDEERQHARRARLLAAHVDITLAAGEPGEARAAADELAAIARETEAPALVAAAERALGAVRMSEDRLVDALEHFRRARSIWQDLKLPYELACARMHHAAALRATGDVEGAEAELRTAVAAFERLGAAPDLETCMRLLGDPALPAGLTAREAEVLRLVAAGKTNRDIAVELVISEHTVGRHLQNLYAKLRVSSRAGATAFAFEHDLT